MAGQTLELTLGANPAENYQRFFVPQIGAPVAADLLAAARLLPGERVLDVACGTGVVARLAAERVGPSGTVAGLDIHPAMLAVARSESTSGARWYEASAESMPLADATFDVVLCQMGLQFVTDKRAALREMHRVLVPGCGPFREHDLSAEPLVNLQLESRKPGGCQERVSAQLDRTFQVGARALDVTEQDERLSEPLRPRRGEQLERKRPSTASISRLQVGA